MNIRTDIVTMYKEVHSWAGIIAGLCLFIAFYAGAITMFEEPLQRWASPPIDLPAPVSLERAPELVEEVLKAHPEAAEEYSVNVHIDGNRPARVSWEVPRPGGGRFDHDMMYAALDAKGQLVVSRQQPSSLSEFVNMLHQKIGLPVSRPVAMPIMGIIAFLYAVAITSGVTVLLPSLVKDLFALRLGKNLKRMWLDVHNLLGLFSLPFHIVMAVTSVGFAYFPYWYQTQEAAFGYPRTRDEHAMHVTAPLLPPATLVTRVEAQAPGFRVAEISYHREKDGGLETHVAGPFPGRAVAGGSETSADVDATTGKITEAAMMPGKRDNVGGFAANYMSLHFGNFGGDPVRWMYFLLGIAGAALFYTGNLLWIETRRKKERKAGLPTQTRSTRILGALTVGVPLGCVAGLSATIAAAKLLGNDANLAMHSGIYYAVFVSFIAYALLRGAARSGAELAGAAAVMTVLVPIVSALAGADWYRNGASILVDTAAICIAGALLWGMFTAHRRARNGNRDSVWAMQTAGSNTSAC